MGTKTTKINVTFEANEAVNQLASRFPEWSAAQLASKLLIESSEAILAGGTPVFPTVDYIRGQLSRRHAAPAKTAVPPQNERPADPGERYESLRVAEEARIEKKPVPKPPWKRPSSA